jgi:hypothetical protein
MIKKRPYLRCKSQQVMFAHEVMRLERDDRARKGIYYTGTETVSLLLLSASILREEGNIRAGFMLECAAEDVARCRRVAMAATRLLYFRKTRARRAR